MTLFIYLRSAGYVPPAVPLCAVCPIHLPSARCWIRPQSHSHSPPAAGALAALLVAPHRLSLEAGSHPKYFPSAFQARTAPLLPLLGSTLFSTVYHYCLTSSSYNQMQLSEVAHAYWRRPSRAGSHAALISSKYREEFSGETWPDCFCTAIKNTTACLAR